MSRFPKDRPHGPLAIVDRLAVPIGATVTALILALDALVLLSPVPPPGALLIALQVIAPLIAVIALVSLAATYQLTHGSDRQRILPVLVTFTVLLACLAASDAYNTYFTAGIWQDIGNWAIDAAALALAVAVAHGVIRHRVIDVSFVVSRTLVYTVLTSLVVGTFALIDFLSGKFLEHLGIAYVLEAGAALAFGVWMNSLHSRVDHFVDRVLFRRRHLAEARLERTGRTLSHAENERFIDEALVIEACDALDLASGAVFRLNDGAFARAFDQGWDDRQVQMLGHDDHLIVNLSAELATIDLLTVRWPRHDVPHGLEHPILAMPFVVRHGLIGFVLYGGHRGGEAIDPDERRTLERLVESATAAYERLRAKALQAEADELRAENARLEHERALLREMLDTFKVSR
ncbi:MAG: hypothetical protein JOZ38_11975 [Candidatus Eremiobacteraeota bacterium]|nr:hypothetical protein [Candidatus Eremiobacteraeota bacterium]